MEHWNGGNEKENMETGQWSQDESVSITFTQLLDIIVKDLRIDKTNGTVSTHREKVQDQIETRLKLLFPEFNGLKIGQRWRNLGHWLSERDLFDNLDASKCTPDMFRWLQGFQQKIHDLRKQYHTETETVIIQLCYVIYLYSNEVEVSQKEKDSIAHNIATLFSEANHKKETAKSRRDLYKKIKREYGKEPTIKAMGKKMYAYRKKQSANEKTDLMNIVSHVSGVSDINILIIMTQNPELIVIKDGVQRFIDDWQQYFLKKSEKNYIKFRNKWFFEDDPNGAWISDTEVSFIQLLFEIIPYDDRSVMDALKKGRWYMIPEEQRGKLILLLSELAKKETVMNRYIGALNWIGYISQWRNAMLNLGYSHSVYLQTKLHMVNSILEENQLPEQNLISIEKHIDKAYGVILKFTQEQHAEGDYDQYWYLDIKT